MTPIAQLVYEQTTGTARLIDPDDEFSGQMQVSYIDDGEGISIEGKMEGLFDDAVATFRGTRRLEP